MNNESAKKNYIAHKNDLGKTQTVSEHSKNTAELSSSFAISPLRELLYVIGLYHDYGKYSKQFQKRINGCRLQAEHSIQGAYKIGTVYSENSAAYGKLIAQLCIAGHHTGIPDCGTVASSKEDKTLKGRLLHCETDLLLSDISIPDGEVSMPSVDFTALFNFSKADCKTKEDYVEKTAFITRYCFSCLTDADTIDTIKATNGDTERSLIADFDSCFEKLKKKLEAFVAVTELQKARAIIQKQAFEKITTDSDIYTVDMPTGSGKTLCGLYCALKRAIEKQKKRIIYVIPYNSIIDQTAQIFEETLGNSAELLRCQSSFSYEDDVSEYDDAYINRARYAGENWDAGLIVTTAVQFFESFYSNKRKKLRKLHNMADSIIVFDEAHLMPISY